MISSRIFLLRIVFDFRGAFWSDEVRVDLRLETFQLGALFGRNQSPDPLVGAVGEFLGLQAFRCRVSATGY
jgi:hypothetical protein